MPKTLKGTVTFMNYTRYTDLFHGSGTIDLPPAEGIAASWHFIKALCGNTHPGATLPFGKYSVCPYSGAYSAGYGINKISCGGPVPRLMDEMRLIGFSHFQHSGMGALGLYYNYAVITPYIGEKLTSFKPVGEYAEPGYYSVTLGESGIFCELTVSECAAYHRYNFPSAGCISIDFLNDGLYDPSLRGEAVDPIITKISDNEVRCAVTLQQVRFYFVVRFSGIGSLGDDLVYRTASAGEIIVKLTAGTTSMDDTLSEADEAALTFDEVRRKAADAWENALGKVAVTSGEDENELRIFYSNLYHSFVKPCDWGKGGFIWDGAPFVTDFTTLWDMYKTVLPLVYTLFPDLSSHIVETYTKLYENLGKLPHCFVLTKRTNIEAKQARLNGVHTIYDAWIRGTNADWAKTADAVIGDIFREEFTDYTENGACVCPKTTHILDMAEGCRAAFEIALSQGRHEEAAKLHRLSLGWVNAFDEKNGLLKKESDYYEGNHWNYSFRPMREMDKRIELAGGAEQFEALLDRFFGFTDADDKSARFEGFNNETDMETPYAYSFIGRQDKTAEIVQAGDRYMYRTKEGTTGRGGIPGNNDSGGMSSCYVWNCLGLFPVSGQNLMFVGYPKFACVTLSLANGNELTIVRKGSGNYPKSASLNGKVCDKLMLSVTDMMQGGELVIEV